MRINGLVGVNKALSMTSYAYLYCAGCGNYIIGYAKVGIVGGGIKTFYYVCDDCKEKENGGKEDSPEDTKED